MMGVGGMLSTVTVMVRPNWLWQPRALSCAVYVCTPTAGVSVRLWFPGPRSTLSFHQWMPVALSESRMMLLPWQIEMDVTLESCWQLLREGEGGGGSCTTSPADCGVVQEPLKATT